MSTAPGGGSAAEQTCDSLEFAVARGDLLLVRYLVDRHGSGACERVLPAGALRSWLAAAEAHEAAYGGRSFLKSDHRFNRELLPILDRQTAGERITVEDLPAPLWTLERGWHPG